jgi:hypothetical protein
VAGCLLISAVVIWYASQSTPSDFGAMISNPVLAFANLPLSFGAAAGLYEHRRRPRILLLILLSSVGATVASRVNSQTYQNYPPAPCWPTVHQAGFPFPWDLTPTTAPWCGSNLHDFAYYNHLSLAISVPGPLFFLFDTIFYAAIMLATLELYRGFRKHPTRAALLSENENDNLGPTNLPSALRSASSGTRQSSLKVKTSLTMLSG